MNNQDETVTTENYLFKTYLITDFKLSPLKQDIPRSFAMLLSSDSITYYKRVIHSKTVIGWRIHCDLSDYTHVTLVQLNMEPYFPTFKIRKICKIYCNLVSTSQTDPFGTIGVIGGLQYKSPTTG